MVADGVVLLVAGAYVGSWDAFCILAALPATAEEADRDRAPGIGACTACLSTGYAAGGGVTIVLFDFGDNIPQWVV